MEPDDLLCSRDARPGKDGKGSLAVLLLAERARSECARSMRAIKGRLGHSLKEGSRKLKVASTGLRGEVPTSRVVSPPCPSIFLAQTIKPISEVSRDTFHPLPETRCRP
mgnify:CR=1 FL=1